MTLADVGVSVKDANAKALAATGVTAEDFATAIVRAFECRATLLGEKCELQSGHRGPHAKTFPSGDPERVGPTVTW